MSSKEEQKKLITEIMNDDAKDGLYKIEQIKYNNMSIKVIYFTAPWCGPCKTLSPIMDEICNDLPELQVVKVNVDNSPEMVSSYNISSVPTLVIEKNGLEMERRKGASSKHVLNELFKKYLDS